MPSKQTVTQILLTQLPAKHVSSMLNHYETAVRDYQSGDWEGAISAGGKFIEATTKSLAIYCGLTLPPARRFSVNTTLNQIQPLNNFDDTVRILIPRACRFVYDIASNRGARHDPDQIDPNKMDASVVILNISWILAELIRFCSAGAASPEQIMELVEQLVEKKYPDFEDIDGNMYVNLTGLSARDLGLLLLNIHYPKRMSRAILVASIRRHGFSQNNANLAATRLRKLVDDDWGDWKLRAPGRQEAERILSGH